jgi:UDP-N-acetyl-D-mannosaminuronic acid dehydrogenase
VLGIPLAISDYEHVLDWMDATIAANAHGYLTAAAVNLVMSAQEEPDTLDAVLGATLAVPDGMPLVWALKALGHSRATRVYGPDLMLGFCARAATNGTAMYLYGGRDADALKLLETRLQERFPGLRIAGGYAPPFRALTAAEQERVIADIDASRAAVVWVGIGQPKQERWMRDMRPRLRAPLLVGVGSRASHGACGVATRATTPASSPASRASTCTSATECTSPLSKRAPLSHTSPSSKIDGETDPGPIRPVVRGVEIGCAANLCTAMATAERPDLSPHTDTTADVAVIGLGRVGLPLALSFADRGLRTVGIDNDPARLRAVRDGVMPFRETGTDELLERVHRGGLLECSERVAHAARARHIVITLGTPSFSHIEIDMRDIRSALDDLLGVLAPGHALTLRSTVAPGTTDFVAGYLTKHRGFHIGHDVFVAHAPERIAAGRFLAEIDTLPCIVGGVGERSGDVVAELFGVFGAPIVQTTPVQAELAKIWTNILRYANFALPNLLMMDCERHDANVFDVIDLINRDYPRGGIAKPGLTAGTCLRKDFAFSEERSNAPGMLLAVSRVNESVPLFLLEGVKRRSGSLANRKVAVLGLAFKADTDDERDSLAHKLIRLLERELADVATHDPHVATPTASFAQALADAHVVFIAADHAEFRDPAALAAIARHAAQDCLVVDPWNCWGAGQVFAYAAELAALGAGA